MRHRSRVTIVLLLLAAVTMVVQLGSVPHAHAGANAGFYNQEHDLTLLAGLAGQVVPVDAPTVALAPVVTSLPSLVPERPTLHVASSGDSRAPPAR